MCSSPEVQRPSVHQFCINADCGRQDWDNRDSLRPLSIFHPDVSSSECIQNHFPERLPCWECKWLQVVLECVFGEVKLQRQNYFIRCVLANTGQKHTGWSLLSLHANPQQWTEQPFPQLSVSSTCHTQLITKSQHFWVCAVCYCWCLSVLQPGGWSEFHSVTWLQ